MKTKLTMMLLAGGIAMAAQTPSPATPAPAAQTTPKSPAKPLAAKPVKPKKAAVATQPLKIPAGAVKTAEGNYRVVDAQGKAWLYRETPWGVTRQPESALTAAPRGAQSAAVATGSTVQTPFGPSKVTAETPRAASPGASGDPADHITAVADGDVIHFEKPTPFGMSKWQKNKSDLTAAEQKIWDREQAKRNQ